MSFVSHRSRPLAIMLAVALITGVGFVSTNSFAKAMEEEQASATMPKLVVMKFHADWCGSCKTMGPLMQDLQNHLDGHPILFVTLDLTNNSTRMQSELMAAGLGLGDMWAEYGSGKKTGFVVAFDTATGKPVGLYKKNNSMKEIAGSLKQALAAATTQPSS